jgi:hypothetical protein
MFGNERLVCVYFHIFCQYRDVRHRVTNVVFCNVRRLDSSLFYSEFCVGDKRDDASRQCAVVISYGIPILVFALLSLMSASGR